MKNSIRKRAVYALWAVLLMLTMASAQSILVLRAKGQPFEEALKGIADEVGTEMRLNDVVVDRATGIAQIEQQMKAVNPDAVVLMDNVAIGLYKKYEKRLKSADRKRPTISCMGVFVGMAIKDLQNAAAVSYEVPIVTSLVNLRSVSGMASLKVGIIHREFLSAFVAENAAYCKREDIQIIPYSVPNRTKDTKDAVRKGLEQLLHRDKVNALWVSNDNVLLQADIISQVWIPMMESTPVPVVVGVEGLVDPQISFGVFAVLPDHVGIGSQVAQRLFQAKEAGWKWEQDHTLEPPLSVYKIVNMKKAGALFAVDPNRLNDIDRIRQ